MVKQWIKRRPELYKKAINAVTIWRGLKRSVINRFLKLMDTPGLRSLPFFASFRLRTALALNQRNQLYELADLAAMGGRADLILAHALTKGRQYGNAVDFFKIAEKTEKLDNADQLLLIDALRMSGQIQEARQRAKALAATSGHNEKLVLAEAILDLMDGRYMDASDRLHAVEKPTDAIIWMRDYVGFSLGKEWQANALMRPILESRRAADDHPEAINIGIVDYKSPDLTNMSSNIGDYVQTIAVMRHIARHMPIAATHAAPCWSIGVPKLERQLGELRKSWPHDAVRTSTHTCNLVLVDRDCAWSATNAKPGVPIWLPIFGWFAHSPFMSIPVLPYPPEIRPLFFSFHLNKPKDLTGELIEYLRQYEPIGCRDWSTRDWLMNQNVKAFFTGCVTTTLKPWYDPKGEGAGVETLNVEAPAGSVPRGAPSINNMYAAVKQRPFETNVDDAMALLERFGKAREVVTSRLHCYLPSKALGSPVTFLPRNEADRRFDGLAKLDDAAFDAMRSGLTDLLDQMLSAITNGDDEKTVYALWHSLTQPLVERDQTIRYAYPRFYALPAEAQTKPSPARDDTDDPVVPIALAFDANIASYVPAVIASIEANRTGRAEYLLLVRDLPDHFVATIEAACGDVPRRWFKMDHFLKGEQLVLIPHTTISTMDRLYLPELLPDYDKVIYLDIDIIVQGDVSELFATDISKSGVGGRASINPFWHTQVNVVESICKRLEPQRAFELRRSASVSTDLLKGCFNAGVLVASLDRMRHDNFTEQAARLAVDYKMNDQDILNVYSRGDFSQISPLWNAFPYQELIDPNESKIIHWAGGAKPWADARNVRFKHHWQKYATQK